MPEEQQTPSPEKKRRKLDDFDLRSRISGRRQLHPLSSSSLRETRLNQYDCSYRNCGFWTNSSTNMDYHLNYHARGHDWQCPICYFLFQHFNTSHCETSS